MNLQKPGRLQSLGILKLKLLRWLCCPTQRHIQEFLLLAETYVRPIECWRNICYCFDVPEAWQKFKWTESHIHCDILVWVNCLCPITKGINVKCEWRCEHQIWRKTATFGDCAWFQHLPVAFQFSNYGLYLLCGVLLLINVFHFFL